jgi:hypothetical protein
MNASRYIGRIGGLAVALGVGAALFTGNGIAWAEPDSDDSSVSSTSDSDASDSKPVKKTPAGPLGRIKASKPSGSTAASTSQGDKDSPRTGRKTLADILGAHRSDSSPTPQSASDASGSTSTTPQPKKNRLRSSLTDLRPQGSLPTSTISAGGANDVVVKTPSTLTSLLKPSVAPHIASPPSTPPLVSIVKNSLATRSAIVTAQSATPNTAQQADNVANVLVTVVNRILRPSAGTTPTTPPVDQPAALVLLAALRRELSGAAVSLDQPSATTASPTLVLNGYNVVATSTEHVISFYGLFTAPPAAPGTVQGTQEFKVVDPDTGKTVGTFDALVSNTNSFVLGGGTLTELYVTDSAATAGSDPAATPPAGTLISSVTFGKAGRLGFIYTVTPSGPDNVVSFKLTTPFRDISIPLPYDGTDVFTAVSRPFELNEDYYIAPAPDSPENITSISGIPPLFTVAQGEQVFNVYQKSDDGNDVVVGSFKGYVTTTSDAIGATTEAILVTEVIDGPVGTDPSQVPQVGSVYNVIYRFGVVYSANTPGPDDPDKYSFVPASELQPIGVNGLPPREVEIQGYQQFDVYDSDGNYIGTVDADVTTHYGLGRTYTEAILVTNSTGDAPPPGSQFNFVVQPFRVNGFGLVYSAVPSDSGGDDATTSFIVVTPFGHFSIPAGYNAIKGLDDVEYFDPFVPVTST